MALTSEPCYVISSDFLIDIEKAKGLLEKDNYALIKNSESRRLSSLNVNSFKKGRTYGIEFALDRSSHTDIRKEQSRWNSYDREGFHENPSLWGELVIKK